MATTIIFTLIFSTFWVSTTQAKPENISLGSSLTPQYISSWLSPSGVFAFGFYPNGNGYNIGIYIAKIPEKTVVWTANRDDPLLQINSTLLLTNDGELVVRSPQGDDVAVIVTGSIYYASMLDSGNFVCYDLSGGEIYSSFSNPTDTILPSQTLTNDQEMVSSASESDYSSGNFRLKMQSDGNLVQYPMNTTDTPTYAYWDSGTYGMGDIMSLNFDNDGHLYLLNSSVNVMDITKGVRRNEDTIFIARIDVDGIFRTYSYALDQKGNWSIEWESSKDKCDPKGLCGLNGFCVSINENIDCKCLPGFDYVSSGNWNTGCQRNFTTGRCHETINYSMIQLDQTVWEDDSYSALSLDSKEDCQKACLEDCNCEAAFFKDGNCRKQGLPLRYGRRSIQETKVAFIKVGSFSNEVPIYPQKQNDGNARTAILIACISLSVFSFLVLAISCTIIYRSRVWAYRKISAEKGNIKMSEDVSLRAFTLAELEQITEEFGEELGRGAFGKVYKGVIPNSQKVVAVKKLERALNEGEREFQTEMKVIGRTHHRNLVRLVGYCLEGSNRLLVYEYMKNGSLAVWLHRPENRPSWDERIAIALDISRGILYLHEECDAPIIHCDIKPQNILMDENMCAKICDFGLAKLLQPDQTNTYTDMRGTRGYVAPEWHKKLPVTVKADVYSFGIVLFEIICCRKSVDWSLPEEEAVLEEWVYDCFEAKQLRRLVGEEEVEMRKLERMIRVGLWCIQDKPSLRPSMKKVMLMLEGTVEIPVPPSPKSFLSTI